MKLKNTLFMVIALAMIFVVSCTVEQSHNDSMMEKTDVMEEKVDAMEKDVMEEDYDAMEKHDDSMMEKNEAMEEDPDAMEKHDDSMMEKTDVMEEKVMETTFQTPVLAGTTTPYVEFNQADYEKAIEEGKTVLLNFYASWCPPCQTEQKEAFAAFNDLELENTVGFRVNYKDSDTDENEEALAKEFGITYQHTKVILQDGEQQLKDLVSWKEDKYVEELMRFN